MICKVFLTVTQRGFAVKKMTGVLLATVCFLPALLTFSTTSNAASGVIRFHGGVVEPPCKIRSSEDQVSMACAKQKSVTFSAQQVARGDLQHANIKSTQFTFINPQHTNAILEVSYR
ncbi:fimbrial assembly protein [Klebsiella aerogenes]|jgi:type 1 fimbria pilin|nr:Fimbrial protein domain-containing protein [Klebsiella aerogenes KCTC 2190]AKK80936.1 fimbrial assembly protein [Klebsiella aerogenes]AMQ61590.1 fimbrial assembly protein [Klebsiella aerogenes]ATM90852.1 fimbrial assembly protein [Klebsiella aerogenes]ATX87266.1 fimbrial assembly protein [Klebsiella aerogenes]